MPIQDPLADLARHGQGRDVLLDRIVHVLRDDPRVVAAWLTGSLAWGTADHWSDLDLHVAVADEHYSVFVAQRRHLFERIGPLALAQEIKVNTEAPAHFTLLVYQGGLEVDCSLWSLSLAHRPAVSRLLFDRAGVPVDIVSPESPEERGREATHQLAFFWAMATVGVKCVGRGYTAGAAQTVEMMTDAYDCLWRLLRLPDQTHPELIARRHRPVVPELAACTPRLGRAITPLDALRVIRALCVEMEGLHPALAALCADIPTAIPAEVTALGDLAEAVARHHASGNEGS